MLNVINRCGSCTQCCYFTAVAEMNKTNHEWCMFCEQGKGCRGYTLRPSPCREYVCLYYACEGLSEEFRPDKCGVVFERLTSGPVFLALVDPSRRNCWQLNPARKVITKLIKDGYSLIVHSDPKDTRHILLAEGHTTQMVIKLVQDAIRGQV